MQCLCLLATASKLIGILNCYHINGICFNSGVGQGELYLLNFFLLNYEELLQSVLRLVLQFSKNLRFPSIVQNFGHLALM